MPNTIEIPDTDFMSRTAALAQQVTEDSPHGSPAGELALATQHLIRELRAARQAHENELERYTALRNRVRDAINHED